MERENETLDEELARLRDEIAVREKRAARFGTFGRIGCALCAVALCVALGTGKDVLGIVFGVLTGCAIVGYVAAATAVTKRLDALRAEVYARTEETPHPFFEQLAREFDATELESFTRRVEGARVRAFRDPRVLETEFTFDGGRVVSCEFCYTQARMIVDDGEAYTLRYDVCSDVQEVLDVVAEEVRRAASD